MRSPCVEPQSGGKNLGTFNSQQATVLPRPFTYGDLGIFHNETPTGGAEKNVEGLAPFHVATQLFWASASRMLLNAGLPLLALLALLLDRCRFLPLLPN